MVRRLEKMCLTEIPYFHGYKHVINTIVTVKHCGLCTRIREAFYRNVRILVWLTLGTLGSHEEVAGPQLSVLDMDKGFSAAQRAL